MAASGTIPSPATNASLNAGNDRLRGEDGDDTITDNFGSAVDIDGGIDDDTISIGTTFGTGTVEGGAGLDILSLTGSVNLASLDVRGLERLYLNANITARAIQFDAFDRIAISSSNLTGTVTLTLASTGPGPIILDLSDELADGGVRGVTLTGSGDAETITTGNGNNSVSGGLGDDTLNGGIGNDTLNGGAGVDLLNGSDGNDSLHGNEGNDTINGGLGNDIITGDSASLNAGSDRLRGER